MLFVMADSCRRQMNATALPFGASELTPSLLPHLPGEDHLPGRFIPLQLQPRGQLSFYWNTFVRNPRTRVQRVFEVQRDIKGFSSAHHKLQPPSRLQSTIELEFRNTPPKATAAQDQAVYSPQVGLSGDCLAITFPSYSA
jgi:hypothetical protein